MIRALILRTCINNLREHRGRKCRHSSEEESQGGLRGEEDAGRGRARRVLVQSGPLLDDARDQPPLLM